MKSSKGSVTVSSVRGNLRLRLPRGLWIDKKQVYLSLGLTDNLQNRKAAEIKAKQIELDILSGYFDPTLKKYQSIAYEILKPEIEEQKNRITFVEIYQKYIDTKKDKSATTWKGTYINTLNHLNGCPYQFPDQAMDLKDWMIANKSLDACRRILMQLNTACNWAAERELIKTNPFLGKSKIKAKKSKPKIHPFSSDEKLAILDAFEKSEKFNYLLPLVKFFFLTGCRTSEAIGLRWKNIKTDCSSISFEEVIILGKGGAQRRQGTKQSPQRDFPCNKQLQDLLLSIKSSKPVATASVFLRPDGSPITHQDLRTAWYGKGAILGIVRQLAADGQIDSYRPQYNTRHTMISACLEAGISPIQIALWCGNSAEIIFRNYAGIINKVSVPEF
ncbi:MULTISPECIES: tyrosine-type recombinase/integrase [unclassified Microcoleus]|uniref:tyrosine-type recombinase/integrase n=1 Tax=unclassified Microcoleus TaxID=2642155 RepID=UPI002FD540D0